MKLALFSTILLCVALSGLSEAVRVSHRPILPPKLSDECAARADKCSIIRAMEEINAKERKILGTAGVYRWYYHQNHAKHVSGDPNLCLHASKCH